MASCQALTISPLVLLCGYEKLCRRRQSVWARKELRGYGQQGGEADQDVARFAGLQLREKRRANKNEQNNRQDSRICAEKPCGRQGHAHIQKIEQREPESNFELGGIVVVTFGERPEASGKRQQRDAWSEPHRGGPLDGNPKISANRMAPRALAFERGEFEVERTRHAWRAIVAIQQGSDARKFLGRIHGVGRKIFHVDRLRGQFPSEEIGVAKTKHPGFCPRIKAGG